MHAYIYLHKLIWLKKLLDTKPSKAVIREKRKMDQNFTRLLKFIKSAIASSFDLASVIYDHPPKPSVMTKCCGKRTTNSLLDTETERTAVDFCITELTVLE